MAYRNFYIILILFLCVITSCSDKNKEEITLLVTQWQGKEIIIPSNSIFTIQGKDTVDVNLNTEHKPMPFVIYPHHSHPQITEHEEPFPLEQSE